MDEAGDDLGWRCGELTRVNAACGAVDREEVALVEDLAGDGDRAGVVVDPQCGGTTDTNFAHLTRDKRCVG